jgi:hypothetical protein
MSKPELTLITGGKSNVPIDLIDELFEPAAKALQDRSHRRPPTTFAAARKRVADAAPGQLRLLDARPAP